MNKVLDFIENHKFGIIITMVIHVALFIYFQFETYQEPVTYNDWDFSGRNIEAPDDIEITPDQIETPQESELLQPNEKVTSFVKDANDTREESMEENINYTSYEKEASESVQDYESRIKEELNMGRNESDKANSESNTDLVDKNKQSNPKEITDNSTAGSEKKAAGYTMVEYSLSQRNPLNKNDWYIRNPGYTCGNVNGVVTVRIEVAQSGNVVDAKYIPEQSSNADECMIRRAEEYALKSRFNYDGGASKHQEGTITYRFVYR
jgi:hypothetical protein